MRALPERYQWREHPFIAGALCLEFTNTVGDHGKTRVLERLGDWTDLLGWAQAVGAFERSELATLRRAASREAAGARRALRALLDFRELVFRVLSATAAARAPLPADMRRLQGAMVAALRDARLARQQDVFHWMLSAGEQPLQLPLARIALSCLQLLQSEELVRLRECQRCSWLFLDRSKSHGRRWCEPATCGNRARVARHYLSRA